MNIQNILRMIGYKWSYEILQNINEGSFRFNEFLVKNPDLSTKMLAKRLKGLESCNIVEKNIVSKSPVIINYTFTARGKELFNVIKQIEGIGL